MADANSETKRILVLARSEPEEAMRVAAGLTIFGHELDLVFMHRELTEAEADGEHGELLELCEITPLTTVPGMQEHFTLLEPEALATLIRNADMVMSL